MSDTKATIYRDSIRVHRVRAQKTQGEVAAMLGVRQGTVSAWETGNAIPNGRDLQRLAALFGCSADAIELHQRAAA